VYEIFLLGVKENRQNLTNHLQKLIMEFVAFSIQNVTQKLKIFKVLVFVPE